MRCGGDCAPQMIMRANNTSARSTVGAHMHGRARIRWWALGLILLVGLSGALIWSGHVLLQPHPERFANGVSLGGPALEAAKHAPLTRRYLQDFQTQEHWSSCGPASLRNVLASLDRPVAHERDLFRGDTAHWLRMLVMGMTLDEVAELAEAVGIGQVQVRRDLSEQAFRDIVQSINTPGRRLIINFDRAPIHGVSLGHFSPIAEYDPASDRVLLLDVTPGFGLQLVPTGLLYAAMRTPDPVSGRARGLLQIDAPGGQDDTRPRR